MWRDELIVKPKLQADDASKEEKKEEKGGIKEVTKFFDPLSIQNNSKWKQHFDDKALWEEIEKDVKRTRKELSFFIMAVNPDR